MLQPYRADFVFGVSDGKRGRAYLRLSQMKPRHFRR